MFLGRLIVLFWFGYGFEYWCDGLCGMLVISGLFWVDGFADGLV